MKKINTLNGFVLGIITCIVLNSFILPTLAATIETTFNSINITINEAKVASIGESYKLDNGT